MNALPNNELENKVLPTKRLVSDSIGAIAAELLGRCSAGRVLAVFERSVYLQVKLRQVDGPQPGDLHPAASDAYETDNALLCIAHSSVGAGPLQINIAKQQGRALNSPRLPEVETLEVGAAVAISDTALRIYPHHTADINQTYTLHYAGVPTIGNRPNIGHCGDPQRALHALIRSNRIAMGVAPGLEHVLVAQQSAIVRKVLIEWLSEATPGGKSYREQTRFAPLPEQVCDLLGMGLGLTPAGDDYLAGVLLGLRFCRRDAAVTMLESLLGTQARQRTNRISRAHLTCVRAGCYQGDITDLFVALRGVLEGTVDGELDGSEQRLDHAVIRLAGVGHTSGEDLLGGLTAALHCSK